MTGSTFNITILLPNLPLHEGASEKDFPKLAEALNRVAINTLGRWKTYALGGERLPDGKVVHVYNQSRYAQSIAIRQTGEFSREVYSDLVIADQVEKGFPRRDLKRMLWTSRKARMSKNGKRYLIIPFRHGVPTKDKESGKTATGLNIMPRAIYKKAKDLKHSSVTGSRFERSINPNRTGRYLSVKRLQYRWGERLPASLNNHFAGMVKFQNPKRGGSKETQYLTFRVMSEDSSGWLVPARPGYHVARQVSQEIKPDAQRELSRAYIEDVNERAKSMFLTR